VAGKAKFFSIAVSYGEQILTQPADKKPRLGPAYLSSNGYESFLVTFFAMKKVT